MRSLAFDRCCALASFVFEMVYLVRGVCLDRVVISISSETPV